MTKQLRGSLLPEDKAARGAAFLLSAVPRAPYPRYLCRGCNADFTALKLFDGHRVGKHAFTFSEGLRMNPPREDGRRCLDSEEMEAKGWTRDERGRWHNPADAEQVRRRFAEAA